MTVERRDADAVLVQDTHVSEQRTLDAAVASMLAALGRMTDRLAELEAKLDAAQRAEHFAKLKADLDQRMRRADFFDDRAGRLRA